MAGNAGLSRTVCQVTASSKDLAKLEAVDLQEVWKHESVDFTPWLAEPDNLRLLGKTLGMELDDARTEQTVGSFSADIVATNTANNSRVLIENQLRRTDHGHLGQILTYAAGLEALTVVWIAKQFTEEHRAALEWLNNHTSPEIGFFGLEIEVWRIGGSPCAPKFNIVAKPNEWTKRLPAKTKQTPLQQAQFDFWSGFRKYAAEHARRIRPIAPQPQNWMSMAIGRHGFEVSAVASTDGWDGSTWTGKPEIRAEFAMLGKHSKQHFDSLRHDQATIDAKFSEHPEWYSETDVQRRKVYFRNPVDWQDPDAQEDCFEWLIEKAGSSPRSVPAPNPEAPVTAPRPAAALVSGRWGSAASGSVCTRGVKVPVDTLRFIG